MNRLFTIALIISSTIIGQTLNTKYGKTETILGSANKVGDFNFVEYIVTSDNGRELYRIVDKVDYDIPYSKLEVFDDGSSVLINSFYGTLTFLNYNGEKGVNKKIFENVLPEYERSVESTVCGKSIIILVPDENGKKALVQKYNSNGDLLNEFTINQSNINGISYSEKADKIFVSHNNWNNSGSVEKKISVYNTDGKRLKTFNGEFEKGFFTTDKQFIGYSNKLLLSIDEETLELRFVKNAPKNKLFVDVSYNGNIIVALANKPQLHNGKWLYSSPTLTEMTLSGKTVKSKTFDTESFSEFGFKKEKNEILFKAGKQRLKPE